MPRLKKTGNFVLQSDNKYRQTMIGDYFPNSRRAIVMNKSCRIGKENNDCVKESAVDISLGNVFGNILLPTFRNSSLPFDLPSYKSANIELPNLKLELYEPSIISSFNESSVTLRNISSLSANVSSISSVEKRKKTMKDSSSDDDFIPSPKRPRRIRKISSDIETHSSRSSFDEDFIPSPKRTRRTRKLSSDNEEQCSGSSPMRKSKLNCKTRLFSSVAKKKSDTSVRPTKIQTTADKDKPYSSQQRSKDSTINNMPSCSFSKSTSSSMDEIRPFTNENIKNHSTPQQKVTILSDIVCNRSPQKLLLQKTSPPKSSRQSTNLNAKFKRINSPKKSNISTGAVQEDKNDEEDTWGPMCLTLFRNITKFIYSHKHLATMFTGHETAYLNAFLNMNCDKYQFFCFKLYMRQPKWQNIFKFTELIKSEMSNGDVKNMYDILLENKFVISDMSSDPCVNLLHALLVKDIKDICKKFKIKAVGLKKGELIEKLLKHCSVQSTLTLFANTEQVLKKEIIKKMGICVKINPIFYDILKKIHLVYSFASNEFEKVGDIYWFLSQIQTKDIFMPTYRIDQEVTVFSSIEEFSQYSDARDCKRDIENCFTNKTFLEMLNLCEVAHNRLREYDEAIIDRNSTFKPPHLLRFSAHYQYISALSLGTKYLSRHYPEKVKIFLLYLINSVKICQRMRGKWLDSLVKLHYVYLKKYEEAADILLIALKDKSLSDVDIQTLTIRGELMKGRKTNPLPELVKNQISFVQEEILDDFPCIEISSQTTHTNTTGGKRLYIKKDNNETSILSVESVALNHYKTKGYPTGIHCEGRLFGTLFCVLFWDIIYDCNANVNGAFILETQYYPLDLTTPHFYTNRQKSIDQRLNEIKSDWPLGQLENFMSEIWENHSHKYSLISQNLVSEVMELYEMVLCIGRSKLAKILERIIKNYKLYHSGLPDLFLWNKNTGKCKFVEVKGERDKLSDTQRVWLNFLRSIGCDIEVCHVHTIGSKYTAKAITVKKMKSSN